MTERVVAIVPMRHNSERVPGKNYRPIGGKPLYHHVIDTLLSTEGLDEVVIDTDSPQIKDDAAINFPPVTVLDRPEHLRDGSIAMNDVLINSLTQLHADVVVQTHSTSPFLTRDTMREAIRMFSERADSFDSLFSVTRMNARLWDEAVRPVNHDPKVLLRTQDLPPLFIENSSFFIFTPNLLSSTGSRIGPRPRMFELTHLESLDIDVEDDFALAAAIFDARIRQ